jgi:hypothetical protein
MGQTVHHKSIYHFQCADMTERRAEKLNNLLHTHSIFCWLDLLNKRTANCLNKRISPKPQSIRSALHSVHYRGGNRAHYNSANSTNGSIVWTIAEFFVWTKESDSKRLNSYNFDAGLDYENTAGSERLQAAE